MNLIQRQVKNLLRNDSKDPYFEATNIKTGKVTKYNEGSLYLMLGGDEKACDEVNRLARTGEKSKDGNFTVKKISRRKLRPLTIQDHVKRIVLVIERKL